MSGQGIQQHHGDLGIRWHDRTGGGQGKPGLAEPVRLSALAVDIHPFPTADILGRTTVYAGEPVLSISVTELSQTTPTPGSVSPEGSIVRIFSK
jgi:hypothetical protein